MNKNEQERQDSKNIHQVLDEIEVNLSQINPALDDLAERIRKPKNELEEIADGLAGVQHTTKIDWKFILTTTPLYFSLLAFFAILIGAFITHFYLNSIGYISVFSEIIGDPSTLIGIVVAYSLLVFLLAIYFTLPFCMFLYIKNHQNVFKNFCIICTSYAFYILISFLVIVWAVLAYNSHPCSDILFNIGVFACVILPLIIFICFKKSIEIFLFCLVAACLFFYSYIYPFLYIKIIVSLEVKQDFQLLLFLAFPVANILINGTSLGVFYKERKQSFSQKNDSVFMGVICVSFLILSVVILSFFTKFSDLSLYIPRFIEKPQDSSWYLIHNDNNTSKIINGLSKTNIKNYKHVFEPNSWREICKEDVFTNTNMSNCSMLDEYVKDMNDNALYGYMTWNLGNIKVFCPQSVNFFDDKGNNKEKSEKCLVIEGKYLQPINEYYLSK